MRAILFASATVTSRTGRRSSSPRTHAPAALFHCPARYTIGVAPSTRSLRISRLPAFVIRPRRVLPPVECWLGTRPSQAAKCRALLKFPMPSPTVAASSEAVIGALIGWLRGLGLALARVGLEAGPLSRWLYAAMREAGLAAELLETRHVRDAFKAMPVKTARKDARGIAQLMRLGWFRPVHRKSVPAQETRALLTARKLPQTKHLDVEMSLRGVLRGFGLKGGPTTPRRFAARVRELVEGHATRTAVADALLAARETLGAQLRGLEKRLRDQGREDERARRLMTTPGVGVIVALTFAAAVDDPARFRSSKAVGAHFGLTPKRYRSGETDVTGRISKIGDAGVRTAFYEAANIILTRPVKGSALKSWAARLAARAGMRKAKVALARKLAVVLHRMLADGSPFAAGRAAATA